MFMAVGSVNVTQRQLSGLVHDVRDHSTLSTENLLLQLHLRTSYS